MYRLLLPLLLYLTACNPTRSYEAAGRVVGFGSDARTIIIEHEEIPGLMPAMAMPFKALDTTQVRAVTMGDAVGFTLFLNRDSSWIDHLTVLPDDAVARYPAGEPMPSAPSGTPILQEGDRPAPFELVDQDGRPVRLADFQGRALLLTFIYTRCPLPEYCPLMSQRFRTLQPLLQERFGDRVHLLSVSFDADYDAPEVLRAYAGRYTDDTASWSFASGSPEQIRQLTTAFGVFYQPDGTDSTFVHNLTTALIGPDGRIATLWRGNDWTADEVLQATGDLLAGTRP